MRAAAVGAALLLTALCGAAQAKDPIAEGRYHLRKANALAGDDRCRAAIHEYTLAYQKLQDPVVLFNRAECYRRLDETESAVADYRAFLEAVPAAPNRAEIEAKIAALGGPAPATPAPPPEPAPAPDLEAPAEPPSGAAPVIAAPATDAAVEPATTGGGRRLRTWVWIALGAAVAGGAVGAYLALRTPGATAPATALGNYKF